MSRAIVCLVTLGFAAMAHAQAPARDTSSPAAPTATGVIRGRVTEAGTNRPLAHALVRAASPALRADRTLATDASGRYEISELPHGRYSISAVKTNYIPVNYGEARPIGPGAPIEIADGQTIGRVDFALQHAGVMTGRIVDEYGDPLAETQVTPMRWAYVNGERRLQSSGPNAMTNDLGEYRIFNVRPGQYAVAATLRNPGFDPRNPDPQDRSAYEPTFYPGTGNPNQAQRLTIAPGQTVGGLNFALMPIVSVRVRGTVLDSSGQPLAGGYVNAASRGTSLPNNGGPIRPDGTFVIALTPGDYTLRASRPGPGPAMEAEVALHDVSVAGGDVADLAMVTTKPSTLRGRVIFQSGESRLPAAAAVRVTAPHPLASPFAVTGTANAKDDYSFEMKSTAGRVLVRASAPNEWRLRRVTLNGVDVTDNGLDVPANATVEGLVVEMTTHLGRVSGTVVDAAGDAVRDCTVVVFAQDPARWTPMTRSVVSTRPASATTSATAQDATFQLRLPAGDYFAVAFQEATSTGLWNDPEVLAQLREHAVAFSIADDEGKTIEVKLGAPPIY